MCREESVVCREETKSKKTDDEPIENISRGYQYTSILVTSALTTDNLHKSNAQYKTEECFFPQCQAGQRCMPKTHEEPGSHRHEERVEWEKEEENKDQPLA